MTENTPKERIQKVLARAGYGSRRQIEGWIKEGRISINGEVATLGDRLEAGDAVEVNGMKARLDLMEIPERQVIAYHKPVGEVCTRIDPEGRKTIFDHLPKLEKGRWVAIGRLDINTSGLILLTTDGELANRLMHPSSNIDREYAVRVLGEVTRDNLRAMREGVMLEDGMASFNDIKESGGRGANHWYHVVLREGRKREVRRLWESQDIKVSRLMRVRFGPVMLENSIRTGKSHPIGELLTNDLLELVGMPIPVVVESRDRTKRSERTRTVAVDTAKKKGPRRNKGRK